MKPAEKVAIEELMVELIDNIDEFTPRQQDFINSCFRAFKNYGTVTLKQREILVELYEDLRSITESIDLLT